MSRRRSLDDTEQSGNVEENSGSSPRRRSRVELTGEDVVMLDQSSEGHPNSEDSHDSDSGEGSGNDDGEDMDDYNSDTENDDHSFEDEEDYSEGDEEQDEELPFGGTGMAFLNQIQQALLSGNPTTPADLNRIRQLMQAQMAQGFFGMAGNQLSVAHDLHSLLREVNSETPLETLFAVCSQAWELIVLTGEQLGQQEFDSVVDLKPLIPHLLRVLKWSDDCQLLGLEFLMTAIKCTRGILQYSPASMRRLVDGGMIPLLTQQLQHVEYIDLAEDLIFILQLLSRPGAYPRASLHANGLVAVLGFVDFHALPVQVSAFTAAAQMCSALAPESYQNYLLPELLAQFKQTISTRSDEPKLIHWSLKALLNAKSCGVPCSHLFPIDFLQEAVYPLAQKLPADVISVILAVAPVASIPFPVPLKELLGCCFKNGHVDENLLDSCLALIICLLGAKSAPSGSLLSLYLLEYYCVRIGISEAASQTQFDPSQAASILLTFCTQPGSSFSRLQWRSCSAVLLLAIELCPQTEMSLSAFGLLSRFISSNDDVFLRLVAFRWCTLVLDSEANQDIAKRQGIREELRQLPLAECQKLIENAPDTIKAKISQVELSRMIDALAEEQTHNQSSDLLTAMLQGEFTEFEVLGNPQTCIASQLLGNEDLLQYLLSNEEARLACINALNRALLRYAQPFFPAKFPESNRRSNLAEALSPVMRQMKIKIRFNGSEQIIITSPLVTLAMIGSKLSNNTNNIVKLNDSNMVFKLGAQVVKPSSSLIEAIRKVKYPLEMDWKEHSSLWSSNLTLSIDTIAAGSTAATAGDDDVQIVESELQIPERIDLALKLMERLNSGPSKELSALLQAALDSPLLVALNAMPRSFLWAAENFSFLFPFSLRVQLMRACLFDRFRALAALKARSFAASASAAAVNNNDLDDDDDDMDDWTNPRFAAAHFTRLPKQKFTVNREDLSATLTLLFAPDAPYLADSRVLEFAYSGGELGTGHGPTLEFYALASDFYASKLLQGSNGLFPDYSKPLSDLKVLFFQIGAFCGRALLDDRVIDLSLDEMLLTTSAPEEIDYLNHVDEQLKCTLSQSWTPELASAGLEFPSWSALSGKELGSAADWTEYCKLITERLSSAFSTARESFQAGFNASNPADFVTELSSLFTPADLTTLFSSTCTQPWTPTQILSSLLPDHGYTAMSPQLQWLAEIIAETITPAERKAILRFLTGAPGLPVSGWSGMKFTIVSKSDDSGSGVSSDPVSPSSASHDAYLPSVMTCANYLKLPRYSSKEIMRERLWYAIREGNNSFYLS